eukprot:CAMPEP_0170436900 /NCGR_PEP_ID=MMETSP0117_2-20130122/44389_1 /TAXON_ID=400756 /ORGANISM="Durinskia baltica, Strain CSIRO CS-38" /LENGTH=72 /DNA_ID=CAMNT_0010696969 /DNA_START=314 /DNA_END=529 /DNA_ORIENTATION=-
MSWARQFKTNAQHAIPVGKELMPVPVGGSPLEPLPWVVPHVARREPSAWGTPFTDQATRAADRGCLEDRVPE